MPAYKLHPTGHRFLLGTGTFAKDHSLARIEGSLTGAHAGYHYQDLVTAIVLARSMVEPVEKVIADHKIHPADAFDDIHLYRERGSPWHAQIKHSDSPRRELLWRDFSSGDLRIDRLVKSHVAHNEQEGSYCCVLTTRLTPSDPRLLGLLKSDRSGSMAPFLGGRTLRFDIEKVWPRGGVPTFPSLSRNSVTYEQTKAFCDSVSFEVETSRASFDLMAPGPLEKVLLGFAETRLGIGTYPHQFRTPEEVVAKLVFLANAARHAHGTLKPADVIHQLGLYDDYGRLHQQFPVRNAERIRTPRLQEALDEVIRQGRHGIVVGPPGCGKSWALTAYVDELKNRGVLVAHHYCFLELSDPAASRRASVEVMFANLLAELVDRDSELGAVPDRRFAATDVELVEVLRQIAKQGKQAVLVVDGLDHVARQNDGGRAENVVLHDFVSRLAHLELPKGVSLVVGSQPGLHLDVLQDARRDTTDVVPVAPWPDTRVRQLLGRLGAGSLLKRVDTFWYQKRLWRLAERSGGNPLYARYLATELKEGLQSGDISSIDHWLDELPDAHGEVKEYYEYLHEHTTVNERAIVEVIAQLEFQITETELKELLPDGLRHLVTRALKRLRPTLYSRADQRFGVFHESFRRYIIEKSLGDGANVAAVAAPVIDWLERRGVFSDVRAFGCYVPLLYRSGSKAKITQLIDASFVLRSVCGGMPAPAMKRNIAYAMRVAVDNRDPQLVVHCAELARAVDTFSRDRSAGDLQYWETYAAVFGDDAMANRLLDNGRAHLDGSTGMRLCRYLDERGIAPPWAEYIDRELRDRERVEYGVAIQAYPTSAGADSSLDVILGRFRVGEGASVERRIREYLSGLNGASEDFWYLHGLGRTLAQAGSVESALILLREVRLLVDGKAASMQAAAILLGVCRIALSSGAIEDARRLATAAVEQLSLPSHVLECVECGADVPKDLDRSRMPRYPAGEQRRSTEYERRPDTVYQWICSVKLLTRGGMYSKDVMEPPAGGTGWYYCWLRFVVGIAKAKATSDDAARATLVREAFEELSRDVAPVSGEPRAVDLYDLQAVIGSTVNDGLALVRGAEAWDHVLKCLWTVVTGLSTSLQKSLSAPIKVVPLCKTLATHARTAESPEQILEFAERLIERRKRSGTYYDTHAEDALALTQFYSLAGRTEEASRAWTEACGYLAAYGHRRDITIYDPIEAVGLVSGHDPARARSALVELKPMVDCVTSHTDGKDTKHAPLEWFLAVADLAPSEAACILARALTSPSTAIGWLLERSLVHLMKRVQDIGTPRLLDGALRSIGYAVADDYEAQQLRAVRVHVLSRLLANDVSGFESAAEACCAQMQGDGKYLDSAGIEQVIGMAGAAGIQLELKGAAKAASDEEGGEAHLEDLPGPPLPKPNLQLQLPFDLGPRTRGGFVAALHRLDGLRNDAVPSGPRLANAVGYRLLELVEPANESEFVDLLALLARSLRYREYAKDVLGSLAEGLKRHGYSKLAAAALAFSCIYGERGYSTVALSKHRAELRRALEWEPDFTVQVVLEEVTQRVRVDDSNHGVVSSMVELAIALGRQDVAWQCIESSMAVIKLRTPLTGGEGSWFEDTSDFGGSPATLDESLCLLVLARLSNPVVYRFLPSLAVLKEMAAHSPEETARAMTRWISMNPPLSALVPALEVLDQHEVSAGTLLPVANEVLKTTLDSESWQVTRIASNMLQRRGETSIQNRLSVAQTLTEVPTERAKSVTLWIDKSECIQRLYQLVPEFPAWFLGHYSALLRPSDESGARSRERWEIHFGRNERVLPRTPIIPWESELFELALGRALRDARTELWSRGEWDHSLEEDFREACGFDAEVFATIDATRVGMFEPEVFDSDGWRESEDLPMRAFGKRSGWIRLASLRRQWIKGEKEWLPPERLKIAAQGVVLARRDTALAENTCPFLDGWPAQVRRTPPRVQSRVFPLADYAAVWHRTLGCELFVPNFAAVQRLGLRQPATGVTPWRDLDGDEVAVFHHWRLRERRESFSEPSEYQGCELLVRPDLVHRLASATTGAVAKSISSNVTVNLS